MKTSVWDILTAFLLFGILCLIGAISAILLNPTAPYNPFRAQPAALVPTVEIVMPTPTVPTATPTITSTPFLLPATWTPTPNGFQPQPTGRRTLRPTSTAIPTGTPVIVPTLTKRYTGGSGGGRCSVESQSPQDGAYLLANETVEFHWVLKNTSGKTWTADSVDVHNITNGQHVLITDLPYDVSNGSSVDISVNARTPNASGKFISSFGLVQGTEVLCQFYVQFNIQ
jgi:hypothetical protein